MFITQSQRVRQWLKPAEKIGKTAFTNFILQILLLNLIIRIFFNSSCPTPSQSILISVITILIMSVLTMVWLKYFKQGPLEKYGACGLIKIFKTNNLEEHTTDGSVAKLNL